MICGGEVELECETRCGKNAASAKRDAGVVLMVVMMVVKTKGEGSNGG